MKYKEKLLIQTVACMTMMALLQGTPLARTEKLSSIKNDFYTQINKHYSVDDIKKAGNDVIIDVINMPESLNSVILAANETSYYDSFPLDKTQKKDIKDVRATIGGEVIFAGIDKELGVCIKIKHFDKISTYGNLNTIFVIPGDRIIKSEVIGTYDSKSDKELYYQLEDNMV